MSTRAHIGIVNKDGTVREIYHHWDGYIRNGLGEMLVNYYKTEDRINQLLDLGDMSMIGTEPIGYWSDFGGDETMCCTYRERGESGTDARTYSSVDEFLDHCDEDYTYLFKDGQWYYRKWNDKELKLLSEEF